VIPCAAPSAPSQPIHVHAARENGGCLLVPGWHAWEVGRERWPNGVRRVWDDWVLACGGVVTQTVEWVEYCLATDYRRALLLASIGEGGTPEAVAAGFLSGGRWPRRQPMRLHFPAYPSAAGAALPTAASIGMCEEAARRWRGEALTFSGRGQEDASEMVASLGYALRPRVEYVIDLTPGEEVLFAGLKRQHRKNVRRSQSGGVQVTQATTWEAVRVLRGLQEEVARRHATRGDAFGLRPAEAYEALHRALIAPGLARVYLASLEGTPVSASLFLRFGRRALSLYSGSDARGLEAYAEYGMYWQAISDLAREGCSEVQFGSADPEATCPGSPAFGLHEYKLGFGAALRHAAEAEKQLAPGGGA